MRRFSDLGRVAVAAPSRRWRLLFIGERESSRRNKFPWYNLFVSSILNSKPRIEVTGSASATRMERVWLFVLLTLDARRRARLRHARSPRGPTTVVLVRAFLDEFGGILAQENCLDTFVLL